MNRLILLLITALTLCYSCSSDNDNANRTPAEKIVGTWEGEYLQADFGVSTIDVTISELQTNQVAGQPLYGANDLSQCNETFFDCSITTQSCSASWVYISSNGSTFFFDEEMPSNASCAPGIVTLVLTNDNTLSYKWVDISDNTNTASGTLRKR